MSVEENGCVFCERNGGGKVGESVVWVKRGADVFAVVAGSCEHPLTISAFVLLYVTLRNRLLAMDD